MTYNCMSFLTVFQSYQSEGRLIMNGYMQGVPFMLKMFHASLLLLLLHCCFTSTVNIYGHVGTVS